MNKLIVSSILGCAALFAEAGHVELFVEQGVTEDATHFNTVQAAFDAAQTNGGDADITIAPGTYVEKVSLTSSPNTKIHASSENPKSTVISYNAASSTINPSTGEGYGTDGSATFTIGNYNGGVEIEGITIENTAGADAGQAVALIVYGYGRTAIFRRCRITGYQDTLETKNGLSYFEDCYIAGSVDFIFGGNPTLFNRCEIHAMRNGAKVTACAHDETNSVGYLFWKCRVTAEDGVTCNLGRAWYAGANVWWVDCDFGSAVESNMWESWNQESGKTDYRVYGCRADTEFAPESWTDGILTTGTVDDFWKAMAGFGYTSILDIYSSSEYTSYSSFRPTIRPGVVIR